VDEEEREGDALALDTLGQLGGHARVHLDGRARLALLEDADRQVARTGTDLEDDVGSAQVGLVDDAAGGEEGSVEVRAAGR